MNKVHLIFFGFLIGMLHAAFSQPLVAPGLKCLAVATNGDVTLTWKTPADPGSQFVKYSIYKSSAQAGPYSLLADVPIYNQTSYIDACGCANSGSVFYYMVSHSLGSITSSSSDTLQTIFLSVNVSNYIGTLNWNAVSNPKLVTNTGVFDIYSDNPNPWIILGNTTQFSLNDTVVNCSKTVSYLLQNADSSGKCNSVSNIASALYQDITPPALPLIDSVSVDLTSNNAQLGWGSSPNQDVVAYVIYQYVGGFWVPIDTNYGIGNTSFLNSNSGADIQSEWYSLAALDSCGNLSLISNFQQSIFLTSTLDRCDRSVTLSWNPYINWPSGVSQYDVFTYDASGNPLLLGSTSSSVRTFKHSNVSNGSFCYFIRAKDGAGKSATSQKQCITVNLLTWPTFNYLATADVTSQNTINLNLYVDINAKVSSYRIDRADSKYGNYKTVGSTMFTGNPLVSFVDNTVNTSLHPYYYRAIAIDSCGLASFYSDTVKSIFLRVEPNPNYTNTLQWNDYENWLGGISAYEVYRSDDEGVSYNLITTLPLGTNIYIDDVSAQYNLSGHFYYYVKGLEGSGNIYLLTEYARSNIDDVYQESKIYVPNAFVPGSINSLFMPIGAFYDKTDYEMVIINRWGQKIFQTNNPFEGWDGKMNGDVCQEDAYVYVITYKTSIGEVKRLTGTVTLIGF